MSIETDGPKHIRVKRGIFWNANMFRSKLERKPNKDASSAKKATKPNKYWTGKYAISTSPFGGALFYKRWIYDRKPSLTLEQILASRPPARKNEDSTAHRLRK